MAALWLSFVDLGVQLGELLGIFVESVPHIPTIPHMSYPHLCDVCVSTCEHPLRVHAMSAWRRCAFSGHHSWVVSYIHSVARGVLWRKKYENLTFYAIV